MIGILQGRLTPPWNGKLQCFPRDGWDKEFPAARDAGFEAIELIVETEHNPDNPVWNPGGRARLEELSSEFGVQADTLCADCFMTTTFAREPVESVKLLTRLAGFGFRRIVLPFFEKAELRGPAELESVLERLAALPVAADLCLETTLPAAELLPVVDRFDLSVCYDLGNTTALGHDVPRDIRLLGSRISHVHVKDKRKSDGLNVLLGTGDTDFDGAFAALRDIGYSGDYTCETHRGDDPLETAKRHARFVRERLA